MMPCSGVVHDAMQWGRLDLIMLYGRTAILQVDPAFARTGVDDGQ